MKDVLRAELRKLTTIRSTYVILGIAALIVAFVGFYIFGYRGEGGQVGSDWYHDIALQLLNTTGLFIAIAGALTFTHEYRYNTIYYTLTNARSRLSVLLAKLAVTALYAVGFALIIIAVALLSAYLGQQLKGTVLPAQDLQLLDIAWRGVVAAVFSGWIGLLLAALIRNQVGALVVLIIGPGTIEGILSLLLKANTAYLPFTALNQISSPEQNVQVMGGGQGLSAGKATLVVAVYLIIGWLVAAWLFYRRDAN